MKPTYILTDETATIIVGATPYVIAAGQPRFDEIIAAIEAEDWPKLVNLATTTEQLKASGLVTEGDLEISHGRVYWKGAEVSGHIVTAILTAIRDGEDITPLKNFFIRLKKNPSYRMVNGLFTWATNAQMKITPKGMIVAYKKVRHDYTDGFSGTCDNSIGCRPFKERNYINDEPEETCAASGLHFCSKSYLSKYRTTTAHKDRIMVIEVDPADVVSFPKTGEEKGRACAYVVVDEIPRDVCPDDYIAAGLRANSTIVVETTQPVYQEPEDDSVGATNWGSALDADTTLALVQIAEIEDKLGTSAPNLPARIRAAEKLLGQPTSPRNDWIQRIEDLYALSKEAK